MRLRTLKNKDIHKVIINESLITGFIWKNHFKDLIINIDWSGQTDMRDDFDLNNLKTFLYFEFVTEAIFNFEFDKNTMGPLEITSFIMTEKEDDTWEIEFKFNFYPKGIVKFNCNEASFVVEDGSR